MLLVPPLTTAKSPLALLPLPPGDLPPPDDYSAEAAGGVAVPRDYDREVAADLISMATHQPTEAREILKLPHHDVVGARAVVRTETIDQSWGARFVIPDDEIAQAIRTVRYRIARVLRAIRLSQTINDAQVRPGDDHLVRPARDVLQLVLNLGEPLLQALFVDDGGLLILSSARR